VTSVPWAPAGMFGTMAIPSASRVCRRLRGGERRRRSVRGGPRRQPCTRPARAPERLRAARHGHGTPEGPNGQCHCPRRWRPAAAGSNAGRSSCGARRRLAAEVVGRCLGDWLARLASARPALSGRYRAGALSGSPRRGWGRTASTSSHAARRDMLHRRWDGADWSRFESLGMPVTEDLWCCPSWAASRGAPPAGRVAQRSTALPRLVDGRWDHGDPDVSQCANGGERDRS
jgi:hypothetical protein